MYWSLVTISVILILPFIKILLSVFNKLSTQFVRTVTEEVDRKSITQKNNINVATNIVEKYNNKLSCYKLCLNKLTSFVLLFCAVYTVFLNGSNYRAAFAHVKNLCVVELEEFGKQIRITYDSNSFGDYCYGIITCFLTIFIVYYMTLFSITK